ncbi:MAG TPA: tetratricopeptide repeat protein [Bacteroidales bacterium]|nr:tetratricopeptide repeat protein [Bacteroidales bacterium]
MQRFILIAFVLIAALKTESYPCTIIMVSGSNTALAGSNEDSVFPLTMVWYVPASGNYYARVCFGYKMIFNSIQGGMNEKGLFVDGNSLGKQGWKQNETKKTLIGPLLDMILATCANIEEVKEFFNTYNTPVLDQARIPVMDKSGASMIVEWYNGDVVFLETDETYQVATNFVGSKYIGTEKPCWRYNRAVEHLGTKDSYSVEVVRDALDATHVEVDNSITVYSFICDLKNGDIYVCNYHDYNNPLKFNLKEEIMKGQQEYYLGKLFGDRSVEYEKFIEEGPVKMVEKGYNNNINVAFMFYGILSTNYPKAFNKDIGINVLSQAGMNLFGMGKIDDCIIFLERNVEVFPDSARSHFELANVYLKTNNNEKAMAEYNKTLEINPDHREARLALDNLQNR